MSDESALVFDDDFFDQSVRRAWHRDRLFFSVVDVVGVLTDAPKPRVYWGMMKQRLASDEGFVQLQTKCVQLKMTATDGKMRETECADAETLREICRFIPAAAPWRRKDRRDEIVYAIGLSDGSIVKIGVTTDLLKRLRSLQNSSPLPLALLWQMSGDDELERKLHTDFSHRRAHGEWFDFADTDVVTELQKALVAVGEYAA